MSYTSKDGIQILESEHIVLHSPTKVARPSLLEQFKRANEEEQLDGPEEEVVGMIGDKV